MTKQACAEALMAAVENFPGFSPGEVVGELQLGELRAVLVSEPGEPPLVKLEARSC